MKRLATVALVFGMENVGTCAYNIVRTNMFVCIEALNALLFLFFVLVYPVLFDFR